MQMKQRGVLDAAEKPNADDKPSAGVQVLLLCSPQTLFRFNAMCLLPLTHIYTYTLHAHSKNKIRKVKSIRLTFRIRSFFNDSFGRRAPSVDRARSSCARS